MYFYKVSFRETTLDKNKVLWCKEFDISVRYMWYYEVKASCYVVVWSYYFKEQASAAQFVLVWGGTVSVIPEDQESPHLCTIE